MEWMLGVIIPDLFHCVDIHLVRSVWVTFWKIAKSIEYQDHTLILTIVLDDGEAYYLAP